MISLPLLPAQLLRIGIGKHKGARHCPFAGIGGFSEDARVGLIKSYGAQQFHHMALMTSGRTQLGRLSFSRSE